MRRWPGATIVVDDDYCPTELPVQSSQDCAGKVKVAAMPRRQSASYKIDETQWFKLSARERNVRFKGLLRITQRTQKRELSLPPLKLAVGTHHLLRHR